MSFISAACRLILIFLFAVVPISGSGTNVDDCFKRRIWNVRPYEYGGDSQIWSIANDGKGCVYLAAGTDVCVWDGYVWESYSIDGVDENVGFEETDSEFSNIPVCTPMMIFR